jgi:hypothetical protein
MDRVRRAQDPSVRAKENARNGRPIDFTAVEVKPFTVWPSVALGKIDSAWLVASSRSTLESVTAYEVVFNAPPGTDVFHGEGEYDPVSALVMDMSRH